MKTASTIVIAATLLAACTSHQSARSWQRLPYDVAQGICATSSHCTGMDSGMGGPREPPHWYEDGYGRDERSFHK
ncbi:MAG: hypothetical protein GC201_03100 [Alphaproteobacteria bacterium]|nr:hypothetical protein [Alphaproteobacteria bacterium]